MKDNTNKSQTLLPPTKPQHIVGATFKDFNSIRAVKEEIERLKEAKTKKNV